jgi:hypothetical protein
MLLSILLPFSFVPFPESAFATNLSVRSMCRRCGEYLYDHRNESLRRWLVDSFVMGPMGIGSELVSGMYLDDGWTNGSSPDGSSPDDPFLRRTSDWDQLNPEPGGGTACSNSPIGGAEEMNYNCSIDMGLTQADTTAIKAGWMKTNQAAMDAMHAGGGWDWHAFSTKFAGAPVQGQACKNFFRKQCQGNSTFQRGEPCTRLPKLDCRLSSPVRRLVVGVGRRRRQPVRALQPAIQCPNLGANGSARLSCRNDGVH